MSHIWPYLPARAVNITSLIEFDRLASEALAATSARGLGWRVHRVDLRERDCVLRSLDLSEAIFIDCEFSPQGRALVQATGGLCMGSGQELPFTTGERGLYSPEELYSGIQVESYDQVPDAKIYAYSQQHTSPAVRTSDDAMARTLHDHHIGQALVSEVYEGAFKDSPLIGVMGGHAMGRGTPEYERTVELGQLITRAGYAVATGGGPGAMEAANAGAWLADYDPKDVQGALKMLAAEPDAIHQRTGWARTALAVKERFPSSRQSLGVPTWFYGHEPPNLFATRIAKFFTNSIREAILLEQSNGGLIVLPGAAGTVQEIFQDACENYYATGARVVPMVLLGREYWTKTMPAWPLLKALAAQRVMEDRIALVDTAAEAMEFIDSMSTLRRRTRW
ncbi:LOG family protein [Glutamicibacter mishrai]|uniref:Rossmann fold nucleotide-binding protein n=1 Tax=Glutamicibacter mishrai TaxID=1775880 RepID=A0A6H0SNS7_9MICC|nr:LOG family protein [Glutamicibacter mishrai]QIV87637.1 Rossmann fold nucleotide-binding protein [Glutamicibacter mishrai]